MSTAGWKGVKCQNEYCREWNVQFQDVQYAAGVAMSSSGRIPQGID
jgi:hypothetical protein